MISMRIWKMQPDCDLDLQYWLSKKLAEDKALSANNSTP
jgi:hypothetical protein